MSLNRLLNTIVKNYLMKAYCLSIFAENSLDIKENVPTLRFNVSSSTSHESMAHFILKSFDIGCSDYIISVNDPVAFLKEYDENIHVTNQRRENRKLIFAPISNTAENRHKLTSILKETAITFVPDVLLIVPDCDSLNCSIFNLATHKYIGESENDDLVILDSWNSTDETFEKNANLFPEKMLNMQGRILKVATFNYKPYSILELDENDAITGLDGTEMKTCIEFCRWSNCTIKIIRDDEHEWGEIWDNRTGNGILGNIVTDRADIGYGALYSWYHEYLFLDLSMPVVRTGITCIAPVPKLVARWLLPILPFNYLMWLSVFVAVIVGSAGLFITGKVHKKPFTVFESILANVGILVAQVPPIQNPTTALRYVLCFLLLLSLVLSNVYSSGLASSVTVPKYEDPIDTVQDLVDSNLDWGATHDAWIFSILLSTEPNIVRLVEKFKKQPEKRLAARGKTGDFAFSVERLPAGSNFLINNIAQVNINYELSTSITTFLGHFAIGEYVTEETVPYLQLMSQDIYWEQCVIMARKSSPFTRRINKFLGRLHQAGLLHSWETQVVLKHSNFKVQLAVLLSLHRHGDGSEPKPLDLLQIQGPIFLLIFGCIISTVAFIIEYFVGHFKCNRLEI